MPPAYIITLSHNIINACRSSAACADQWQPSIFLRTQRASLKGIWSTTELIPSCSDVLLECWLVVKEQQLWCFAVCKTGYSPATRAAQHNAQIISKLSWNSEHCIILYHIASNQNLITPSSRIWCLKCSRLLPRLALGGTWARVNWHVRVVYC